MKNKDEEIKNLLLPFKEEFEQELYYCYGVATASLGQVMALGYLASFANQYFYLGFTNTKLIMIYLDILGKPKNSMVIEYKHIKDVKISNWLLGFGTKIKLRTDDNSKIKLKISKRVMGIKNQRENLNNICNLLQSKF